MGYLGVLPPNGRDAGSVSYAGPNRGQMFYNELYIPQIEDCYPSTPTDRWIGFLSDYGYIGNEGDTYEITLTINTDPTTGFIDVAFLATSMYEDDLEWNGDPCTTTVEMVGMNLESSTWGSIKTDY
jgi:hypothetical protein